VLEEITPNSGDKERVLARVGSSPSKTIKGKKGVLNPQRRNSQKRNIQSTMMRIRILLSHL